MGITGRGSLSPTGQKSARGPIADLKVGHPLNILGNKLDPRGRFEDTGGPTRSSFPGAVRQGNIGPPQELSGFARQFVELLELHDVRRTDLGNQPLPDGRQEREMKIVPETISLQVRIHSRERRRHRPGPLY